MPDTSYYRKSEDSIEQIEIKLIDSDGEEFDMQTLRTIFKDTLDNQKDKLEKIIDFGTGILGDHYKAVPFMFGWVIQRIINTYEQKNDTKLTIETVETALDSDEIKEKTLSVLENLIEDIKNDELDIADMPLNMTGMDYE